MTEWVAEISQKWQNPPSCAKLYKSGITRSKDINRYTKGYTKFGNTHSQSRY